MTDSSARNVVDRAGVNQVVLPLSNRVQKGAVGAEQWSELEAPRCSSASEPTFCQNHFLQFCMVRWVSICSAMARRESGTHIASTSPG